MRKIHGVGASGCAVAALLLASQPLLAAETSGNPRPDTATQTTEQGSPDADKAGSAPTSESAQKKGRHHHRMHQGQHAKSVSSGSTSAGEGTGAGAGADETDPAPK
jgi:hypothetical protein